jgi:diadenosine tetraphosphate (Ap4A) HIT family hydrolase
MSYLIDPSLKADSLPIVDLDLCALRLMNDQRFPWLLLIPRRVDIEEVLELTGIDQQQLWDEVRQVAGMLQSVYAPTKLNIAALGNQVRQLHVHVIARFSNDAAWPNPVWGLGKAEPYPEPAPVIAKLQAALNPGQVRGQD